MRRGVLQGTVTILALALLTRPATGQAAATVPASSPIYERLEAITAHYPTDRVPLGVRPQSRRALRGVVEALRARVAMDTLGDARRRDRAMRELDALGSALEESESRFQARGAFAAEFNAADVRPDTIESNGQGRIDAIAFPLLDLRFGRPRLRGGVASVLPTLSTGIGSSLAFTAQPRFSTLSPAGSQATAQLVFHRLYLRGVVRNVALQVGLDEALWGQSGNGALFVSGNAEPMPAISVSTDTSIRLPWILRFAGPVTFRGQLALLGRAQDPPNAKVAGWHATMQPVPRFELGVSIVAQQGGQGAPSATLLQRVVDLLPIIDALAPQRTDLTFSNKLAGGNLRIRVPEWSGLDLYYELMIDDFDLRRFESTVVDDFSHLLGARLPLQVSTHRVTLRAELHNMGLRTFEHSQFLSGYTFRQRLIGSPLGPNAKGLYGSLSWEPDEQIGVRVGVASELRDPSIYTTFTTPPFDEDFRIVRMTDDPRIRRRRATLEVSRAMPAGRLGVTAGLNRAWRDGGRRRTEWDVRMAFSTQRLAAF